MHPQPLIIILISTIMLLASCRDKNEPAPKPTPHPITIEQSPPSQTIDPEPVELEPTIDKLTVPAKESEQPAAAAFPPEYTIIGEPEEYHYSNVRRFGMRIRVERGRTREEIEQVLRQAALDLKASRRADAIDVLAFAPGDDASGIATVAKGILAPNGRWSDAAEPAPIQFRLDFFSDMYFQSDQLNAEWNPGDEVELWERDNKAIRISSSWEHWGESSQIASVAPGTKATIAQKHIEPLVNEMVMIRYEIEFVLDGKTIRGWIDRSAVEGPAAP